MRDKPTLARVLGVLNSEMAISESYGGEFSRSVEWWGERRERNVFWESETLAAGCSRAWAWLGILAVGT